MTDLSKIYEEFNKHTEPLPPEFWDKMNKLVGKLKEDFYIKERLLSGNPIVEICDSGKHEAYKNYNNDKFCKDCGKEL